MTHPLIHLIVPVAVLLLLKFDRKLVLYLSPIAVLPDFDYFVPPHRILGHSILFGVMLIATAYFALNKRFDGKKVLMAASVMFLSHMLLDGSVAWLYPITDNQFGYRLDLGKWVWDRPDMPKKEFSESYIALQLIGIAAVLACVALWPYAMSKARRLIGS